MRARLMMAIMLMTMAGCEEKAEFRDKAEEYRYLRALANPTPEQWKRKEVLRDDREVMSAVRSRDAFEAAR